MGKIIDSVSSVIDRFRKPSVAETIIMVRNSQQQFAAGRVTVDHPYRRFLGQKVLKADEHLNQNWQLRFVEEQNIAYMETVDLLNLLRDLSPDFSRALHDFVQFTITPGELVVDNDEGQRIVDEALETMRNNKEGFITKLEKVGASIFLHGAIFSELVLDLQGINFVNLNIIDATLAQFQENEDPVSGQGYLLGQHKDGRFTSFQDDPTVKYVAFDPVPGSPFGRSLSAAAIFPVVFALQMLKDLRQVIRTQAYPFNYATLDREALLKGGITDSKKQEEVIQETQDDIKEFLEQNAGPFTCSPVVGSEVEFKRLEAASASLQGIESMIDIVSRMIIRGLKTYPIIFGLNTSSGLSDSSPVQSELHYIFIDSVQRKIEDWVESNMTEVLRARGNPGTVSFKLKRINTLVNKQRTEIEEIKSNIIDTYRTMGAINPQEARDLIRHPDPFGEIAVILPQNLPMDAQPEPDEVIEVDEEETDE